MPLRKPKGVSKKPLTRPLSGSTTTRPQSVQVRNWHLVQCSADLSEQAERLAQLVNESWEAHMEKGAGGFPPTVRKKLCKQQIVGIVPVRQSNEDDVHMRKLVDQLFQRAEQATRGTATAGWLQLLHKIPENISDRTVILRLLSKPEFEALSNDGRLETKAVQEKENVTGTNLEQTHSSERIGHALAAINTLTLPEIDRLTGELTSTKKNRIAAAVITHSHKNLGTIIEATTARYDALGTAIPAQAVPKAKHILRLLSATSKKIRKSIRLVLNKEFALASPLTSHREVFVKPVKPIRSLDDIDRLKHTFLSEFVFRDNPPSKQGFVNWFEELKGKPLSDTNVRTVCHALNLFKRSYGLRLFDEGREVTIGVPASGGRGTRRIQINPIKGEAGSIKCLGQRIPPNLTLE